VPEAEVNPGVLNVGLWEGGPSDFKSHQQSSANNGLSALVINFLSSNSW
jgi:hypothetical protein